LVQEFSIPLDRPGLLFRLTAPHRSPAPATLSNWFSKCLATSSAMTRRVVASDMRKILPSEIASQGDLIRALELGHWSQVGTFVRHYYRPKRSVQSEDLSRWSETGGISGA
jgi:hypothetical protein